MLRSLDSSTQAFLSSMDQISRRLDRAQREISTGLKVSNIADSPDQVSTILQSRADIESNTQIQANLGLVKSETDAGEQTLQSAVGLLERARVLGAQGAIGTAPPDAQQSLASEIGSIMEQMAGLAQTTSDGRYIFSGNSDHTAPYTIDLTAANPVSAYAGGPGERQIQHPNGSLFQVSRTAQEIFDSTTPENNVFQSLNSLRTALMNGDTAGINTSMATVGTALTHLNSQLSFYGTVQNKVAEATDFASKRDLQLKSHLSYLRDADLTSAIVELTQAQAQQSAALQVRAKTPPRSLFDFLG